MGARVTTPHDLRGAMGIFGGTFDPIHVAHLAVAEAARDTLGLDRVLFGPAGEPPHKLARTITPAEHRLAMVEAAIADNPAFEVSRVEVDRSGPSYTADTLAAIAAPAMALIISAEAFRALPTWHEPERIVERATIVVAPRDGYPDAEPGYLEHAFPRSPVRVVVLDGPRMRLSASELRSRAAAGRSVRYLVQDAVPAYSGHHSLYQDLRVSNQ